MSPDKLFNDPVIAPFMMGMVVRIKDFAELKGVAIVVASVITFIVSSSFFVGVFYTQTNAMMVRQDEYISKVDKLSKAIVTLQGSQNITNNNVAHIRGDMDELTAQMGQMQSNIAKMRR